MMKKIAAIDIGSNAVRLAIAEYEGTKLTVTKKLRVPLRLGGEAFEDGVFSEHTIKYAAKVFEDLNHVIKHEHVELFQAIATSAFRDTSNSADLAKAILRRSGIKIEAIDGELEATLVRQAVQTKIDLFDKSALMMDIGGGSMELSIIQKGEFIAAQSFDIGTVRVLKNGQGLLKTHDELIGKFLKANSGKIDLTRMIGTGGNFRAMLKLKKKVTKMSKVDFVTPSELKDLLKIMTFTPYLKRIKKYDLRPDRADVIVPAMQLVLLVAKHVEIKRIYAPNVGLIHGVLARLTGGVVDKIRDMSN